MKRRALRRSSILFLCCEPCDVDSESLCREGDKRIVVPAIETDGMSAEPRRNPTKVTRASRPGRCSLGCSLVHRLPTNSLPRHRVSLGILSQDRIHSCSDYIIHKSSTKTPEGSTTTLPPFYPAIRPPTVIFTSRQVDNLF